MRAVPLAPDRNCACARPPPPEIHCCTCHGNSVPGPSLLGPRPVHCRARTRDGFTCGQDLAAAGDFKLVKPRAGVGQ